MRAVLEPERRKAMRLRPVGTRTAVSKAFLQAFHEDFLNHGAEVIETVRVNNPETYLRVAASLVPKDIHVDVSDFRGMDREQLLARYAELTRSIEDDILTIEAEPDAGSGGAGTPDTGPEA